VAETKKKRLSWIYMVKTQENSLKYARKLRMKIGEINILYIKWDGRIFKKKWVAKDNTVKSKRETKARQF
jgi:hypothetical protein